MTVIVTVIISLVLILLIGYLLIFKGLSALAWAVEHPLGTIFLIVVGVPVLTVLIFLILGLIL